MNPQTAATAWLTGPKKQLAGLVSAVGAIKRFLYLPCAQDPMIYVEAMVPAALRAFYDIVSPDPKEVYHKTMGKSLVCDMKSSVIEAGEMRPVDFNGPQRFLFSAAEVVDMTIWYLFLADVGEDALINWGANIIKLSGCFDHSHAGASGTPWGGGYPDTSFPPAASIEWSTNIGVTGQTCTVPAGDNGYLAVSAACKHPFEVTYAPIEQSVKRYESLFDPRPYEVDYDQTRRNLAGDLTRTTTFTKLQAPKHSGYILSCEGRCLRAYPDPYHEALVDSGYMHKSHA